MDRITELAPHAGLFCSGLLMTWLLTALGFAGGCALGIGVTVLRISPVGPLRGSAELYVQVFRNIPGVTLLAVLVYALPSLELVLPYFVCALLCVILIPAAFCSEFIMAGIRTVPPGQVEAARALGMGFMQIVTAVVLPQALRASVLPLTSLLIATLLTTALASQVPMEPAELTGVVARISTYEGVGALEAFIVAAALYCASALAIGWAGSALDRRLRRLP